MAKITAMSRCAGLNHVHFTIERTSGAVLQRTYDNATLQEPPPMQDDEYQVERVKLLIRESQARGNTTFAQISADLIGREFVE